MIESLHLVKGGSFMDFWQKQSVGSKKDYIEYLKLIGALSNLFSDSQDPYLYYRAHENLFCHVFDAKNLSRGDVSFDAVKDGVGIGLKTFLHGNGSTFQKVAEFNSDSDKIRNLKTKEDIVYHIAKLRNMRISTTQNITESYNNIYHLVTRESGKMNVIETPMDKVDLGSLRLSKRQSRNTIKFRDNYNEYSFSLSKNTLLKRFNVNNMIIKQFDVDILEDPLSFLKSKNNNSNVLNIEKPSKYIVLPLYSPKTQKVSERSSLNQWNAKGRRRDVDEVYIPIPSWIHDVFEGFFEYSKENKRQSAKDSPSFDVELPNGKVISCKVAQSGGKALMSNPNKVLGQWILRDVLKLKERSLLTMELLNDIGIDSVKLSKKNDSYYYLDFMESGSYEEFSENNYAKGN